MTGAIRTSPTGRTAPIWGGPLRMRLRRALLGVLGLTIAALPVPAQTTLDETAGPAPVAVPAARKAENVAVITVRGAIDQWTSLSIDRRMRQAQADGADAIVFDLDTPGGEVGAVLEICNVIKNSPIPNTVAWVHPDAYSGGAIMALACREIVVAPYATMGDAAPVSGNPLAFVQGLQPTERQKILAPLIAEIVDSARRRGYDEKLVQGFLMLGVELWQVENIATGEHLFIGEAEYRALFDGDPIRTSPRFSAPGGNIATAPQTTGPPAPPATTPSDFRPASDDLDSQTVKDIDDAIEVASNRPIITPADKGKYRFIEYTTDGTTLLTLKTEDLIALGLAKEIVADDAELLQFFGAQNMARLNRSWSESLARFLSSFPVKGLLIVVFLLGLFIEMSAPGMGLAGGVALAALIGLMAPQFIVGAAAWWWLAAVIGGLGLLVIEAFVIPGFGVFGIGGLGLLFAGLLGVVVGPGGLFPDSPNERQDLIYGATTVMLSLFTAFIGMYFVTKHYGRLPVLSRLVLSDAHPDDEEYGDGMLSAMAPPSSLAVGEMGVAVTDLRPGGTAEFGERLVDVVCDTGYVEQGTRLRVVDAKRMTVLVTPVEDSEDTGLFADVPDEIEVERDLPIPEDEERA